MSDPENKMNILIEEANANYNANRYKDAARTFEHLITLAIQNEEEEEAIYFAYRAADCWRKDKNEMNRAIIFRDIGNLAYSFCSKIIDSYIKKSKKPIDKAKAMMLAGECLLTQDKTKATKKQHILLLLIFSLHLIFRHFNNKNCTSYFFLFLPCIIISRMHG